MIAYINAISAVLECQKGIVVRHDSLGEDRKLRDALYVRDYAPVDSVILMVLHILRQGRLLGILDLILLSFGLVRCQVRQV